MPTLLESARPFLRGELECIDKKLPSLVRVLQSVGAGECWHKHGTFLEHLLDIYRILKIWKAPNSVCLCTFLEHHYSDDELRDHLDQSSNTSSDHHQQSSSSWRKKVQSLVPAEGIRVKHIKTGEEVLVSRRIIATFVLMTMADFSDQLFGFQDELFDNGDGRLEFVGNKYGALWPGDGKPGLWMNSISRMGALYTLLVREEKLFIQERGGNIDNDVDVSRDEDIELVMPPVFDECTKVLDATEQIVARDLYWKAVCERKSGDESCSLLKSCIEKNPFVGEPHVVLAQVYLTEGKYEEAVREAERGLRLLVEWGSPWDKRMSWQGWIAWARVLLMKAQDKSWPQTSWGILNLGLVK